MIPLQPHISNLKGAVSVISRNRECKECHALIKLIVHPSLGLYNCRFDMSQKIRVSLNNVYSPFNTL